MIRSEIVTVILICCCVNAYSQTTREFNATGNRCNFHYVLYNLSETTSAHRRPIIVVVGKESQSGRDVCEKDSLKFMPAFYGFQFVYVPRVTSVGSSVYDCLPSLMSLLSHTYSAYKQNRFLYLQDTSVKAENLSAEVRSEFQHVYYAESTDNSNGSNVNVQDLFRATIEEEYMEDGEFSSGDYSDQPLVMKKIFFGAPTAFNVTLSGIIRDAHTGEALPSATVRVNGSSIGTASNMDGYFLLQGIPTDTTSLLVQYLGYQPSMIYLAPQVPRNNFVINLYPSTVALKTVNVVGAKQDIVLINENTVGVVKITPKKLEQLPNLGEKDVMRAFQLMPGVSGSNESSSGLYVRGGTPDQNLILYDGFTVYHVDHLYGFFSAFNSNALKDMQLYKGGFESRFGGRLSSVTEITGKEGNQKKVSMGGDLSLLSMNAYLEVPIGKKFSTIVAFRRSYKGPIYNKIFKKFNTGFTTTTPRGPMGASQKSTITSYFYDLNGKFTFKPNDKDIISLSFFNGTDKLDNSTDSGDRGGPPGAAGGGGFDISTTDLTRYGNIGTSLKWSRKIYPKLYVNTVLSYSNYYSKRDRSQDGTITSSSGESQDVSSGIFENNDLRDYSIKSDYQWDMTSWNQIQFGGFSTYYDIKYTYAQNDTITILDKHNKSWTRGGYVQSRIKLFSDKVQLVPGIRLTHFAMTDRVYYEPRASLIYHLTNKLTVKGATGRYYQFANRITREDILSGSRDFWILSDGNNIPVSKADHYIAGISYDAADYVFSVEGYYKELSGLSEYSLRINSSPFSVDYSENFLVGSGYSKGIEFLAQRKSDILNGWVSYTLARTRYDFAAYGSSDFPANQDVTHEFKAVGIYTCKKWDFSATWIFATGRPFTAPSGAYTVTLLDGSEKEYFTVTSKNALRLPDYHRCDISATRKLYNTQGRKRQEIGSITCSVFNLYNRKNVWYKQFSIVDGEILESNVNYLGMTPNLTLSLKLNR